jgi:hypothetical protein
LLLPLPVFFEPEGRRFGAPDLRSALLDAERSKERRAMADAAVAVEGGVSDDPAGAERRLRHGAP